MLLPLRYRVLTFPCILVAPLLNTLTHKSVQSHISRVLSLVALVVLTLLVALLSPECQATIEEQGMQPACLYTSLGSISRYEAMQDYISISKHCLLLSWYVSVEFELTVLDTSTNSNESKHEHRIVFSSQEAHNI
jgi:hypothetical protein